MSDESLMVDGRKYLSSRRSAELFGYSVDYIGELCRKGKVRSFRDGRQWYVEEESLFRYLEDTREKSSLRKQVLSLHLSRQLGKDGRQKPPAGKKPSSRGLVRRFVGSLFSRAFLRAATGSFIVFAIFFAQTPVARAGLEEFSLASIFRLTRTVTDELALSFAETLRKTQAAISSAAADSAAALGQLSGSVNTLSMDGAESLQRLSGAVSAAVYSEAAKLQDILASAAPMAEDVATLPTEIATSIKASAGVAVGSIESRLQSGVEAVLTLPRYLGSSLDKGKIAFIDFFGTARIAAQGLSSSMVSAVGDAGLVVKRNLLAAIQYEDTFNLFKSGVRDAFSTVVDTVTEAFNRPTNIVSEPVPNGSESASGGGATTVPRLDEPVLAPAAGSKSLPERIIERIVRVETPVIQNITQTAPGTTVVGGVSSSALELRLQEVSNQLRAEISRISGASSAQISTVYQTIGHATRIDQLSNTVISTPAISGGSWSGANLTGSATVESVTISALTLTTATTTAENGFNISAGCFAVNGVCVGSGSGSGDVGSGTAGQLPFYNASGTTLTATSSIFLAQGGNVGIGTTSPFAKLSVAGAIFANDGITGSDITATGTLTVAGLSSLQNLTAVNVTSTNATTTSSYATTASSTNLFTSNFTLGRVSGFLKATAGAVATALVDLAADVTGILPVGNGGTGWASLQSNTLLLGNGTGAVATTSAGTNGQTLALVDGVPTWVATTTLSTISGTLAATSGGTGQSTFATGDILYASNASTLARLPVSTDGLVLKLSGGIPTWASDLQGSGGGGGGFFSTTTNDMIIYPSDTLDILVLGANATTTTGNILETSGNVKIGGQLLVTSSSSLQNVTFANATGSNATTTSSFATTASSTNLFTSNFTLGRISGFLKATAGAVATALIDLAADVTGILPVGNGGTGVATLPAGSFLVGNGTSAVTSTSSPTVGYLAATSTTATSTFAGAVNIGDQAPAVSVSSALFSVLSSLTKDPIAIFGSNSASGASVRVQNSAGNMSLFVSPGTDNFLTGTVAGNTGIRFSSNSNFHLGVSSALFTANGTSGSVGVGSTTPWAKFGINPIAGDTNQFVVGSSTATSFLINNAGQVALGTSNLYNSNAALHVTSVTKPHLILEDSGDNTAGFANNGSSGLVFGTQNGSFSFRTGITATGDFTSTGSERLLINSSGLVGIGSSTPFAKLSVNPVAGDTNQFVVGSSTATSFLINNAGNVGIGSTSPAQLLSLSGASSPQIYLQDTTTGRAAYFGIRDTFNAVIDAIGGGAVVLRNTGTTYLTAGDSSGNSYFNQGNVGIGTTTPISTAELTITGTDAQLAFTRGAGSATSYIGTAGAFGSAGTDDLRIRSDGSNILFGFSGAEKARFTSGGRFGIGSTTPLAKLSVHANNGETNTFLFNIASSTASATTSLFSISNTGEITIASQSNSSSAGLQANFGGTVFSVSAGGGSISRTGTSNGSQLSVTGSANVTSAGDYSGLLVTTGISNAGSGTFRSFFVNPTITNLASGGSYLMAAYESSSSTRGFYVTSNHRVGIGSTTPLAKLSVHAVNGETNTSLFNVASSTASATSSLFDISNTGVITSVASATSTFSAGLQTTALNVTGATSTFANGIQLAAGCFRGADGSCVGGSSLTGSTGQFAYFSGTDTAVGTSSVFLHTNGFIGIGTSTPQSRLTVNAASNQIQLETGTDARRLRFDWNPTAGSQGALGFNYVTAADQTTTWFTLRDGMLGVGSSTPWAKLAVNPVAGDTNQFVVGSSTATSFIINNAGNVGIGNTSPANGRLNISGGTNQLAIDTGDTTTYGRLDVGHFANGAFIGTTAGSNPASDILRFGTGGAEKMRINASGFVGVASTSPWAKFAINPVAGDTNQFVVGSSTVTSFIINPAGKVGIGLTAPATRLDVFEANASAQLRLSKSASLYSELTVDSTGDLQISAAGGDIRSLTENLWICDNSGCPSLTATSTAGNLFVENAVTFGNGFSFRQVSANELGLYNASSSLLMIFDHGE